MSLNQEEHNRWMREAALAQAGLLTAILAAALSGRSGVVTDLAAAKLKRLEEGAYIDALPGE